MYGAFVWARRALNIPKRRFPARAVKKAKPPPAIKEDVIADSLYEDAGNSESIWDIKARQEAAAESKRTEAVAKNEMMGSGDSADEVKDERLMASDDFKANVTGVLSQREANPFDKQKGWKKRGFNPLQRKSEVRAPAETCTVCVRQHCP